MDAELVDAGDDVSVDTGAATYASTRVSLWMRDGDGVSVDTSVG